MPFGGNNLAQRLVFFLILVCVLAALSVATLYLSEDLVPRVLMSCFVFLSLYFGFQIAKPNKHTKPNISIEIIKIISAIALGTGLHPLRLTPA
jgi:hypothetical protein